jgi:O-acetyl-ADP-ribose deacetylase (regulator of RNase III)
VRCPTGEARITPGFRLPARYVVHTVGPIWQGGGHGEAERLASCYRASLELARGHAIDAIAFPAISCGVFGYPVAAAVAIAVREVRGRLERDLSPRRIVFCCFGAEIASAYRRELADETARADR